MLSQRDQQSMYQCSPRCKSLLAPGLIAPQYLRAPLFSKYKPQGSLYLTTVSVDDILVPATTTLDANSCRQTPREVYAEKPDSFVKCSIHGGLMYNKSRLSFANVNSGFERWRATPLLIGVNERVTVQLLTTQDFWVCNLTARNCSAFCRLLRQ